MSSHYDAEASRQDPENKLLWRFPVRRLEAESIRDSVLAVSGMLDREMGGSMLHVKNREFLFDHTSKDNTDYSSLRRSVYLPVISNNLYDFFQLFVLYRTFVPEYSHGYLIKQLFTKDRTFEETIITRSILG